MQTIYIVGEPGIGKTTLMAELTKDVFRIPHKTPVPHVEYEGLRWLQGSVAQLGVERDAYSGTDGLSMGIQTKAIDFIKTRPYNHLLCEGDRLANDAFFAAAASVGRLVLFVLSGEQEAKARRLARGSHQDETWLKGRQSKVANLLTHHEHHILYGSSSVAQLAMTVKHVVSGGVFDGDA